MDGARGDRRAHRPEVGAGFWRSRRGEGRLVLALAGGWCLANAAAIARAIEDALPGLGAGQAERVILDLDGVEELDTTGAFLVMRMKERLASAGAAVEVEGGTPAQRALLSLVARERPEAVPPTPGPLPLLAFVEDIGRATVTIINNFGVLLSFFGHVVWTWLRGLLRPRRIRIVPLAYQMERAGIRAMPIVGLISFLIGAVVVNQGAVQLEKFGAEILVSDLVGISVLRELGILLTAVILAGRSGSAFTAQIGSMVLNEEVDALKTMGLNPVEVLVLPRILALLVTLPLLTFYADVMGLLGGCLMANLQLGVDFTQFTERLREATDWQDFAIGIIKSVFFAVIIAVVGCFHGLVVERNAESVGRHTTASVVEAIFMVIVLDAFFAVFFTTIGW